MTREELIAALETATGADRELDFWCWWWGKAVHDGQPPDVEYVADNIKRADAPRYTASIDAALTLVPEGMWWHVASGRTRADEPLYGAIIYWPGDNPQPPYACDEVGASEHPSSAALALAAAALKAQGGGA